MEQVIKVKLIGIIFFLTYVTSCNLLYAQQIEKYSITGEVIGDSDFYDIRGILDVTENKYRIRTPDVDIHCFFLINPELIVEEGVKSVFCKSEATIKVPDKEVFVAEDTKYCNNVW